MSHIRRAPVPHSNPAPLLSWDRRARPALDTFPSRPARAVVVGTAGAGKTLALRHLRALIEDNLQREVVLGDALKDITRVPAENVMLIDDLHLLSEPRLRQLAERADDPIASLIVTTRPWPAPPAATAVVRRLEQRTPPIVLGQVSRSDLLDHLEALERSMPEACVDHILRRTAGTAWLVSSALQHHDRRDCEDDPEHRHLESALAEIIAHRLDTVDEPLRRAVEEICVAPKGQSSHLEGLPEDAVLMQGYAEGLLRRGGDAVPLVRSAVRSGIPVRRLIDLSTAMPVTAELRQIRDPRIARAFETRGDHLLSTDPRHAEELYQAALDCGAASQPLAGRRAQAAWASGDLDRASVIADAAIADAGDAREGSALEGRLRDVAAAVWAARGMLAHADDVRRRALAAEPPASAGRDGQLALADASIAALGTGRIAGMPIWHPSDETPTTIDVAMGMLRRGLQASIATDADESTLPDLVRAAEMYSSIHADAPLCEPPAVLAAVVALNFGRLSTAESVLHDAIEQVHGGRWAQRRLLLWAAWVAVQLARPGQAQQLLQRAQDEPSAWSPRDSVIRHAVRVAIARRYDDLSGLEAAWHHARASLLRVDMDLFLVHPFTELISAATALGDAARVKSHLDRALEIVDGLADAPVWSAHVHWAGIQQGILLNSPDRLAPHAKALVVAASRSRVAAAMARAGRVWTQVLAGTVDVLAITAAAKGLAAIGLRWDAARLAGHAAARAEDRRIATQLLACARELHPSEEPRHAPSSTEKSVEERANAEPRHSLSDREIEVARLVLQGKTYAEIGEAIFISPRTAEHHIAHIRRRLGAQSRSEVLARLRILLDDAGIEQGQGTQPP